MKETELKELLFEIYMLQEMYLSLVQDHLLVKDDVVKLRNMSSRWSLLSERSLLRIARGNMPLGQIVKIFYHTSKGIDNETIQKEKHNSCNVR